MNRDNISALLTGIAVVSLIAGFAIYFNSPELNKSSSAQKPAGDFLSSVSVDSATGKISKTQYTVDESQFRKAPEFAGISGYINTHPIKLADLNGKVVLVDFWTYSCINCIRTLPYLEDWNAKYADKGLVIVGIHTPEFEFEKNTENVKSALQRYGIKYPVLQDNVYGTWNAYENSYWPRMYLVDAQGYIRYDKIGESDYDRTEKVIQFLLNERNANKSIKNINHNNNTYPYFDNSKVIQNATNNTVANFLRQPVDFSKIQTPELYFGNQSSRSAIGNPEGFHLGQTIDYFLPSSYTSSSMSNSSTKPNTIYLEGKWKNNPDNVELQSNTGHILLDYSAKSVNIVVGVNSSDKNESQVTVYENNSLISNKSKGIDIGINSKFIANEPRLYNIVNHGSYSDDSHILLIEIHGKGLQAYVFTFG